MKAVQPKVWVRKTTTVLLVTAGIGSILGCARTNFRLAMGRVQRNYVDTFDRVEAGKFEESRRIRPHKWKLP